MSDGTITITNVGVFGIDTARRSSTRGRRRSSRSGAIREQPWVHKGKIRIRHVTQLALSFDHRLVDGALGSQVLADVARVLHDPSHGLVWLIVGASVVVVVSGSPDDPDPDRGRRPRARTGRRTSAGRVLRRATGSPDAQQDRVEGANPSSATAWCWSSRTATRIRFLDTDRVPLTVRDLRRFRVLVKVADARRADATVADATAADGDVSRREAPREAATAAATTHRRSSSISRRRPRQRAAGRSRLRGARGGRTARTGVRHARRRS